MFGTFRDKLKETGTSYKGGSEEKVDEKTAAIHDSKASLFGAPDPGFATYIALNCGIWTLLYLSVFDKTLDLLLLFFNTVGQNITLLANVL